MLKISKMIKNRLTKEMSSSFSVLNNDHGAKASVSVFLSRILSSESTPLLTTLSMLWLSGLEEQVSELLLVSLSKVSRPLVFLNFSPPDPILLLPKEVSTLLLVTCMMTTGDGTLMTL